jgi:hypothetical protein
MKRFGIAGLCVLLLAGMANAAMIDMLWAETGTREITLAPCEYATIDVWVTLDPGETMMAVAWFLLADENGVTTPVPDPLDFEVVEYSDHLPGWDYDRSVNPPLPIANINTATGEFPVGTWKGLSENIMDTTMVGITEPGEYLIANYVIHCVGPSEDVIYFNPDSLYKPILTGVDWQDYYPTIGDPLILHQIPEPGTMGLLALGSIGLVALRRRRVG